MCGFTAIVNRKNQQVIKEELMAANALIKHRGPDAEGYHFWNQVGLGHRRLSIIDVSEKGHQPMFYVERYVLVYNGEIYNYQELRKELQTAGYSFSSLSDTEVLLAAYDYWGEDCLHRFNGMWAFVLLDKQAGKIFIARDRFGIKPVYYSLIKDQFCVASEIKQFTKIRGWQAELNESIFFDFITKDYHDHTEETLFKGVYQLPAGCHLTYDLATHKTIEKKYYDLSAKTNPKERICFSQAKNKVRQLIEEAIQLRLRADVKVGAALSGGIDSAALVGKIAELTPSDQQKLETVSVVFPNLPIDESKYVEEVATKYAICSHKITPPSAQLEEQLKRAIWHQDEPFGSASILAQQSAFQLAAEKKIPVIIGGQGADEIFAGYDVFYGPYFKQLIRKKPLSALVQFFTYFRKNGFRLVSTYLKSRTKKNQKTYPWLQPDIVPKDSDQFGPIGRNDIRGISISALESFGMPLLLHYEDRNSMSYSIESRLPFLDYRLVEYCLALPSEFKIHKTVRKYILRESMIEVLPEMIYQRLDKIGFEAPQERWMKNNAVFVQEQLGNLQIQFPRLFTTEVTQINDAQLKWRLLCFTIWASIFNVKLA